MRCTNCGWDNPDENVRCEKCNSPLGGNGGKVEPTILGKTIREPDIDVNVSPNKTIIEGAYEPTYEPPQAPQPKPETHNSAPIGGTINPWASPQGAFGAMSYCKLSPLPNVPNEKHLPGEAVFKGEIVTLNRANLDPDNMIISQSNQATLTCKNGQWFIKDESSYKTTYIHAGEETPLHNGDIILMGNRRFVFTEE